MSESTENQVEKSTSADLISSLLSSPESLSKISEILAKHGITSDNEIRDGTPHIENFEENSENNNEIIKNNEQSPPTFQNFQNSEILQKLPVIMSLFSSSDGGNSMINKQQNDLLRAIRPYLSPRRQEVLDSFIKFDRLGAIIKKLTQGEKNVSQ